MKLKKGTTLIEVLLYTMITGFFVTTISLFAWSAISAKDRNDSIAKVNDSTQIIIEEIAKSIRNADSVITPANQGESSNTLTLHCTDGTVRTFTVSEGSVIMQHLGNSYTISSDLTSVSLLTFSNVSRPSTPGIIQIKLRISRINPNNLKEFSAENEITISESLR
jgi:hypothetical protein